MTWMQVKQHTKDLLSRLSGMKFAVRVSSLSLLLLLFVSELGDDDKHC